MKKETKRELRAVAKGLLFLSPSLIGFIVLTLIPVIFSLVLCFTKWNIQSGFSGIELVGLANFKEMLGDVWFTDSLKNNLVYTIVGVPASMILALAIAVLLNDKVFGSKFFKVAFLAPYFSNIVAVCAIWMIIFQPTYGPINGFLKSVGVHNPPGWLGSSNTSLMTVVMIFIWMFTGYNMIIYLAGLQGIPKELKEAASIDGASKFTMFRHITLPLLSPTTFFIMVTGIMNSVKVFAPVLIMTDGGPGTSSTVLVYYIFVTAFRYFRMGYASAIAWVLFAIIFTVTYIQWIGQKKWVNYT